MTIFIRNSTIEDSDYIFRSLKELADHDGHGSECRIRPSDIERYGFGEVRRFEVLIAETSEEACGLALYYFTFSPWDARPRLFMSDLFVDSSARGHGVGRQLMRELARIALKEGCIRMDWEVIPGVDANGFYLRLGASPVSDFQKYCLRGEALEQLAHDPDDAASA